MKYSATRFRQNLYQILDQVLATGAPAWIERNGKLLKILPEKPQSKLDRLEPHDVISGDPADLVHMDWSKYWRGKRLS